MRPQHTVKLTEQDDTYVLDGCKCTGSGGDVLCLSLSNQTIRCYDVRTATLLLDLCAHTCAIRDVVATPSRPHILYSAQEDTGVMISDIRQQSPAHFLSEYCGSGATGGTVGVSPSGEELAIAVNGDVHFVDTRMWATKHVISKMHLDEITRVRFVDDAVYCSAGEDQMINFISTSPTTRDNDVLLQAVSCGEVATKMTVFPEHNVVGIIGSCENAYSFPFDLEQPEVRHARPSESTYCVDMCSLNGQLCLVTGVRDDDGNAGPLSITELATGARTVLPQVHKEISRVALGVEGWLVTGGEDNLLVFWGSDGDAAQSVVGEPRLTMPSRLPRVRRARQSVPYIKRIN
uniref:Uncharacterized protein TCIL3000_11_15720 n=1 Tax=Trypanosoma congolense (strain IL3000) TaxID=1068625 RepID=G0V339_TRYCI|nr:unnamed protein product [Trypanosoma congolense IL3000]